MPIPLFKHLDEVGTRIQAASHLLLGLDFDGTLAPIVPRGEDAQMLPGARAAIEALRPCGGITTTIVSGREIADLTARVPAHLILAGNHGLEIRGDDFDFVHPQAAASEGALHRICEAIRSRVSEIPGAVVEDKRLTATVHFRRSPTDCIKELAELVKSVVAPETSQFVLREGRKTFEIRPRVDWNKGSAMLWLWNKIEPPGKSLICYVGDDGTDEDVFRLAEGIMIHVGSLPTAARFNVKDPDEVARFLRWLGSTLSRADSAGRDSAESRAS